MAIFTNEKQRGAAGPFLGRQVAGSFLSSERQSL
jgi:hypothetical protein